VNIMGDTDTMKILQGEDKLKYVGTACQHRDGQLSTR
jgi:hypothetical protein